MELRPLAFLLHTSQDILKHLICTCLRQNYRLQRSQSDTSKTRRVILKAENKKKQKKTRRYGAHYWSTASKHKSEGQWRRFNASSWKLYGEYSPGIAAMKFFMCAYVRVCALACLPAPYYNRLSQLSFKPCP